MQLQETYIWYYSMDNNYQYSSLPLCIYYILVVCKLTHASGCCNCNTRVVCDNGGPTVVLVCAIYTVFLLPAAGSWLAG